MAARLTEERAASHGITPTGHNGPSHDDIRVAVNQQLEFNKQRKALNDEISTFRKGLKAKGITLGVLDEQIRMLEWTPEEVKAHFAERNWYAEAMRYPIGAQLELYGTDATPDTVKEQLRWKNIGYSHGVAGKGWPDEPPEGCPPECRPSYGEGHEEGAAIVRRAAAAALSSGAVGSPTEDAGDDEDAAPDAGENDAHAEAA